jgi:hypothetical protein
MTPFLLVLDLVTFTGPEGQLIPVNPAMVVTLRKPRGEQHFDPDVKCLIHTTDGKFVAVVEDCDTVREALRKAGED